MGSNLTPLKVEQSEMAYYAAIDPPAFALGERWVTLQSAIFDQLRRFKVRLADIKVESTTANPADFTIACWIFNHGAVVRYRLDRVEVWSNSHRVGQDRNLATDMVAQTMAVLRSVSPDTHVSVPAQT